MEYHKYSLSKRGKHHCPACEHKTFVLYIDNSTGNPLHSIVGKCDRADNCGHHYPPKQYFQDNNIHFDTTRNFTPYRRPAPTPQLAPSYIDIDVFKRSLQGYGDNRLVKYLCSVVGVEAANEAVHHYLIGTSKHWDGATLFWQIDCFGRVHTGKIMQYDSRTGKRVKEPVNRISWVHTVLKLSNFNLSQCLFGEHLLSGNNNPVAIVESEKTAIIASCYLPAFIWLACGGCGHLSAKLCEPLRGRNVVLFPDAGKLREWTEKAKALHAVCHVSVSSLIEEKASDEERKAGFDLADYLVRFSLPEFTGKPQSETDGTPVGTGTGKRHPSYVSDTGTLYIPTPPDRQTTYTVYPSVEAYNKRLTTPEIVSMRNVDIIGMKQVFINPDT
ncbi:MAG: DUF6371 domain-containing protein [Tannerellaceae bacterium]|jgi:hypothetical protein|nr:DUF6371 domain-containing protein [Tannerellaceae bacterium]